MNRSNDDPNPSPRDPELDKLLAAYRGVQPQRSEVEGWKAAVRTERASFAQARTGKTSDARAPVSVLRRVVRVAIQVGVAASLGFILGAYFIQSRVEEGQTMSFSQAEPSASSSHHLDADENREVVRVRIE
jgi:hypothetical protein